MSVQGSAEKYCLAAKPVVDETDVRRADASPDESGKSQLGLFFTVKAGERLKEVTERLEAEHSRRNDDARMALVIDGTLIAAPVLRSTISDSLVLKGGDFSSEEAKDIAKSLNAQKH